AVGLFTLLVGAAVRIRRPKDQATLHFFWLCIAFFGAFTFSFNGPLNRLDWVFYWGDAIATSALAPLLAHFLFVFPERPRAPLSARRARIALALLYVPAVSIGLARIVTITRLASNGALVSGVIRLVDRAQLFWVFILPMVALVSLMRAFRQITSHTARRQLRWIGWGTLLGVAPFACGYALPWALGLDPPLALQLTAI